MLQNGTKKTTKNNNGFSTANETKTNVMILQFQKKRRKKNASQLKQSERNVP